MDRIGNVRRVSIEDEMRTAYIDYAMSVIVARAPRTFATGSSRCIGGVYTMHEMGLRSTAGLSEVCRRRR